MTSDAWQSVPCTPIRKWRRDIFDRTEHLLTSEHRRELWLRVWDAVEARGRFFGVIEYEQGLEELYG